MNTEKTLDGLKRPYTRPVLEVIDLVADEVLGIGCKGSTAAASGGGPPCTLLSCSGDGS